MPHVSTGCPQRLCIADARVWRRRASCDEAARRCRRPAGARGPHHAAATPLRGRHVDRDRPSRDPRPSPRGHHPAAWSTYRPWTGSPRELRAPRRPRGARAVDMSIKEPGATTAAMADRVGPPGNGSRRRSSSPPQSGVADTKVPGRTSSVVVPPPRSGLRPAPAVVRSARACAPRLRSVPPRTWACAPRRWSVDSFVGPSGQDQP